MQTIFGLCKTATYSLGQWNYDADVTGCTSLTCIQWHERPNFPVPSCTRKWLGLSFDSRPASERKLFLCMCSVIPAYRRSLSDETTWSCNVLVPHWRASFFRSLLTTWCGNGDFWDRQLSSWCTLPQCCEPFEFFISTLNFFFIGKRKASPKWRLVLTWPPTWQHIQADLVQRTRSRVGCCVHTKNCVLAKKNCVLAKKKNCVLAKKNCVLAKKKKLCPCTKKKLCPC